MYSWDDAKNASNQSKHGASFEAAQLVISASSRHDVQQSWKGECVNKVPKSIRKELAALAAKPESEIDFSDIPATSKQDWQGAVRGKFYRPVK